jgi:hypothetical protein
LAASLTIHPFGDGGTVKPWAAILVEFLAQQNPMDAECFADLNATTAALV